MEIIEILNQIEETASKNEKIQILKDNSDNESLKRAIFLALCPFIKYYIKKIPEYPDNYVMNNQITHGSFLGIALSKLELISNRTLTGNKALDYLSDILSHLSDGNREVIKRVILKDLKAGFGASTVNKVWKGLIPEYKVMLAQPNKEKTLKNIKFEDGVMSQLKSDGMRANLNVEDSITLVSRNGQEFPERIAKLFDKELLSFRLGGIHFQLDGELVIVRDGKILDRKTGNGILNKIRQDKATPEMEDEICFVIWDKIPMKSFYAGKDDTEYEIRFGQLEHIFSINNFKRFVLIESKEVNNIEEAREHFKEMRDRGEEGTILKNIKGPWVNKRSNDLVKMKAVEDADLEIVEVYHGEVGKKYENILGGFCLRTKCGKCEVNVGSGFSDAQRVDFWNRREELKGRISSIQYNEIITNKANKDMKSLFLPIFVEIREDKDEANSLEELK